MSLGRGNNNKIITQCQKGKKNDKSRVTHALWGTFQRYGNIVLNFNSSFNEISHPNKDFETRC